ncbi:MAG TPA: sigma 54-interacting transcriptional regulator [Vicinamibacterales bacterium]
MHRTDRSADEEAMAARSESPLLITARTRGEVEIIARRIHRTTAGTRSAPFVRFPARALPVDPGMLDESCTHLLHAGTGGTLFLSDVEEMPAIVQDTLVDLLVERQRAGAARLITGTTVSLLDRTTAGTFSARLLYQLNVIHLVY